MPTYVGTGFSRNPNGIKAAQEAASSTKLNLGQGRIDFALIFITIHYDPDVVIPAIYETLNQTKMIGTSCAGIISDQGVEQHGIGIVAITSDEVKFESGTAQHLALQDIKNAGQEFVRKTLTDFGQQHRKLLVLFIDNYLQGIENFFNGIKTELGSSFPIYGAGSADDYNFTKSFQIGQNKALRKSTVGFFVGGKPSFGISCQHGFRPLGKPRSIDHCEGNIIRAIDQNPPLEIYKEYFDKGINSLENNHLGTINFRYPLGIRLEDSSEYLLRNITGVTEEGYFLCSNKIPENSRANVMIGNRGSFLLAAERAAMDVKKQLAGRTAKLILIMESHMRFKLLGASYNHQLELIRNVLGSSTPMIGFYGYGEIFSYSFFARRRQTHVQNNSITIMAFS